MTEIEVNLKSHYRENNYNPFHIDYCAIRSSMVLEDYRELLKELKGVEAIRRLSEKYQTSESNIKKIIYYITI